MHVYCTFATAETHLLGVYKPGYFTTPWYKHYQYQVPCPTACAAAASVTEKLYNHARLAEPGCERGPKKCHLPQHTVVVSPWSLVSHIWHCDTALPFIQQTPWTWLDKIWHGREEGDFHCTVMIFCSLFSRQ